MTATPDLMVWLDSHDLIGKGKAPMPVGAPIAVHLFNRDLREYCHEGCASMRERTECVSELKERSYSVGWQICLLPLRLALDATNQLS
jgi:hypothetical protein